MSAHTPGPWWFEEHFHDGYAGTVWGYSSATVACVRDVSATSGDDETTEANARLIAAAPTMREALEAFASVFRQIPRNQLEALQPWKQFREACALAERALAAAEGREP